MSPRDFQARFLAQPGVARQLGNLFEYLPHTDFFAKDRESRFIAVSRGTLDRIGVRDEEELLGARDERIHPVTVARVIREDDLRVMRTGQPIINKVEALYARTRAKDWFLTTKLPIYDAAGAVVGGMGIVRPYFGAPGSAATDLQVQRVVAYVHSHYRNRIPVEEMARLASMSERQLNRRFQEVFRMSVQEFIIRTRIQAATDELLASDKTVAEVAQDNGFYDQSAFTRQFRIHTGETPMAFRKRRCLAS
ncbi:AraC family transcriptional regulator [Verrucomicrobium spinosum]|uniref:AraC family transcriptional regulator n=1 Tax=Verrucomicrobium spinosum TaxID=2736 RepID=UPI001E42E3C5|nr:helix-turn-helix domain-containing protein [Verrucomicrobium spinosum]